MARDGPAIILFGHGSRDPLWRAPLEAVAARLAVAQPTANVRCAYLELDTPNLPVAAADLVANGARIVRILPMFLGTGRHAREDLPVMVKELRLAYPEVDFDLRPAVGEDPRVVELLMRLALE